MENVNIFFLVVLLVFFKPFFLKIIFHTVCVPLVGPKYFIFIRGLVNKTKCIHIVCIVQVCISIQVMGLERFHARQIFSANNNIIAWYTACRYVYGTQHCQFLRIFKGEKLYMSILSLWIRYTLLNSSPEFRPSGGSL